MGGGRRASGGSGSGGDAGGGSGGKDGGDGSSVSSDTLWRLVLVISVVTSLVVAYMLFAPRRYGGIGLLSRSRKVASASSVPRRRDAAAASKRVVAKRVGDASTTKAPPSPVQVKQLRLGNTAPYRVLAGRRVWYRKRPRRSFGRAERVLLISIDGLAYSVLREHRKRMPNLRKLWRRGFLRPMNTVFPSMTWPSHVSIATGQYPRRHGVIANRWMDRWPRSDFIQPYGKDVMEKRREPRTPSLYDVVKLQGGVTAAINWPATQGAKTLTYNLPEFMKVDDLTYKNLSPSVKGIIDAFYLKPDKHSKEGRWLADDLPQEVGKLFAKSEDHDTDQAVLDVALALLRRGKIQRAHYAVLLSRRRAKDRIRANMAKHRIASRKAAARARWLLRRARRAAKTASRLAARAARKNTPARKRAAERAAKRAKRAKAKADKAVEARDAAVEAADNARQAMLDAAAKKAKQTKAGAGSKSSTSDASLDDVEKKLAALDLEVPHLMLVHFVANDTYAHRFGPRSAEALEALSKIDEKIGKLVDGYKARGLLDSTVIIVTADHGFAEVEKGLNLYTVFKDHGLDQPSEGNKKHPIISLINSQVGYLYLRDGEEHRVLALVSALRQPEYKRCVFGVYLPTEYAKLGLPLPGLPRWARRRAGARARRAAAKVTNAARQPKGKNKDKDKKKRKRRRRPRYLLHPGAPDVIVVTRPDCRLALGRSDAIIRWRRPRRHARVGTHGFIPRSEQMRAFLVAAGPGVRRLRRPGRVCNSVDIAPTVAHLLGVKYPKRWRRRRLLLDGRLLDDVLKRDPRALRSTRRQLRRLRGVGRSRGRSSAGRRESSRKRRRRRRGR